MKLILGLGNIGPNYNGTRHNIGFAVVDFIAGNQEWLKKDKFKAQICETIVGSERAILIKPTTYYNLSGDALQAIKQFYKIENDDILVIHDELALPFGTIRTRTGGSDAGNNGLKSIIANCGSDFTRIRIGTANTFTSNADAADFVLGHFSHAEQAPLKQIITKASELTQQFTNGQLKESTYQISIPE